MANSAAAGVSSMASSYVLSSAVSAGAAAAAGTSAITAGLASIGPVGWAVLAVGAISSIFGNSEQKDLEEARRITDKANTDASNRIRSGNNEKAAATSSLNASQASTNNNNKLRIGGDQMTAIGTNAARAFDEISRGSIDRQVRASEELGSLSAQAGAAGVGGSSMRMLQQAVQFRNDRTKQAVDTATNQYSHDIAMQKAGVMSNTIGSLDNNLYIANIDYSINQNPIRTEESTSPGMAVFSSVLGTLAKDPKFFSTVLAGAPSTVSTPSNADGMLGNSSGAFSTVPSSMSDTPDYLSTISYLNKQNSTPGFFKSAGANLGI